MIVATLHFLLFITNTTQRLMALATSILHSEATQNGIFDEFSEAFRIMQGRPVDRGIK